MPAVRVISPSEPIRAPKEKSSGEVTIDIQSQGPPSASSLEFPNSNAFTRFFRVQKLGFPKAICLVVNHYFCNRHRWDPPRSNSPSAAFRIGRFATLHIRQHKPSVGV